MEPAAETSILIPRDPPLPKTVQPEYQQSSPPQPGCGWAARAFWAILSLITGGLAWGLYRAPHSAHGLGLVIMYYYPVYFCLWGLYVCLRRHELLRRNDVPAAAPERRAARLGVWAASLGLGGMIALSVSGATTDMKLKFALIALGWLTIPFACYFLYAAHRARADAGSWPEKDFPEGSPAHSV